MSSSNEDWMPEPRLDLDFSSLDLVPEEGFVLSRIDGSTPASRLPFLTGLEKARLDQILERLVAVGAVVEPPAEPPAEPLAGERPKTRGSLSEPNSGSGDEGNWRRYYQLELKSLPADRRVELASTCSGTELKALCFDADPKVVAALFENPNLGLEHARMVARHHRTSHGLGRLGRESSFVRDPQVQSELFRNPQTPDALLQSIFRRKRLDQLHSLAVGRDAGERTRKASKSAFRTGFSRAGADERVQLILKTEGRCLMLLSGIPLDGKTAALLCRRPLSSSLLVRNLARWPSTPPPLLKHLIRQPIVKRNVDLKNQILRHPNAPSNLD